MRRHTDIERLRAENPVPPQALSDPRFRPPPALLSRILATAGDLLRDELDRLRAVNPVEATALAGQRYAVPTHLLERILAEGGAASTPADRRRPRQRSIRNVGLAGAVLASVTVGAVVWTLRQPTSATAALDRLARHAAQQEALVAGGGYLHTRVDTVTLVRDQRGFAALIPSQVETWTTSRGDGTRVFRVGPPRFPSPDQRAVWVKAGMPEIQPEGIFRQSVASSTARQKWGTVPAQADELARRLREFALANNPDRVGSGMLEEAAELLSDPHVGPRTRETVFRAIAQVDGLDVNDDAVDIRDRRGVGVSVVEQFDGVPTRFELVFDPATGGLLGSTETALTADAPWLVGVSAPFTLSYEAVDFVEVTQAGPPPG